jgi:hypothetical protein
MKVTSAFIGFLFLSSAAAQQLDGQSAKGVIYGAVIGNDGNPATEIRLTAFPLGVPLAAALPHARTDRNGHYRFESIPWFGRYTVYADDVDAGYSAFSTGPGGPRQPPEVTLSPEHPQAEFNFRLPPRAGFLEIHLTDRKTGVIIPGVKVTIMSADDPDRPIHGETCDSGRFILIPSDKDLLLHVTSQGFNEWDESAGAGKPIRLTSGERLSLDVRLEPSPSDRVTFRYPSRLHASLFA